MRGFEREPGSDSINGADRTDRENLERVAGAASTDRADSEPHPYFRNAVQRLLGTGTDAGFQLHVLTDFHERSCYRYASGERDPTGYFIFTTLNDPNGGAWLDAMLAENPPEWWIELQRDRAYAAKVRKAIGELRE